MSKDIKMGDPIILENASGMQKYTIFDGCRGTANSVTVVDDKTYVCFMPKGTEKMYWMDADRFTVDEEALDD